MGRLGRLGWLGRLGQAGGPARGRVADLQGPDHVQGVNQQVGDRGGPAVPVRQQHPKQRQALGASGQRGAQGRGRQLQLPAERALVQRDPRPLQVHLGLLLDVAGGELGAKGLLELQRIEP